MLAHMLEDWVKNNDQERMPQPLKINQSSFACKHARQCSVQRTEKEEETKKERKKMNERILELCIQYSHFEHNRLAVCVNLNLATSILGCNTGNALQHIV
jgi:hypothetical protein